MAKKKTKDQFSELMDNIDFTRWLQALIPVMQPIIVFGAWLGFSMIDKKASAVSKLIALAEPIPTIDLNVPKPVVLASLYHSTDEALKVLKDVIEYFEDIEIPSADEIIDGIKEDVEETILDPITENEAVLALTDCNENAKKNLVWPFPYGANIQTYLWIQSCLLQKGFSVSTKWIKDKL